jgi:hypothetical protein
MADSEQSSTEEVARLRWAMWTGNGGAVIHDPQRVAEIAAAEWARCHAPLVSNPSKFGEQVTRVYLAALTSADAVTPESGSSATVDEAPVNEARMELNKRGLEASAREIKRSWEGISAEADRSPGSALPEPNLPEERTLPVRNSRAGMLKRLFAALSSAMKALRR